MDVVFCVLWLVKEKNKIQNHNNVKDVNEQSPKVLHCSFTEIFLAVFHNHENVCRMVVIFKPSLHVLGLVL